VEARRARTVRRPRPAGGDDRERLRRENALLRLAAAGAPPRRLAAALLRVMDCLLPGCPCEVLLAEPEAGFLEVVGTRGFRPERGLGCRIPIGVGVTGAAARQGRVLWIPDVASDPRYIPGVPGGTWELAVPLLVRGAVVAVVDLEAARLPRPAPPVRRHLVRLAAVLGPAFARGAAAQGHGPLRLALLSGRRAGGPAAAPPPQVPTPPEVELRAVYQPIAELQGRRVIGYEAEVGGPAGGPWASAARLFAAERDPARQAALDLARLRAALDGWRPGAGVLFLDVHAEALRRPGFAAAAAALARERGLEPGELVLEVALAEQVEVLRQAVGGRGPAPLLAIDRFGTGAASAQALIDLRPAYVKLDPVLVRGVDRDFGRRTYIESLCYYTRRTATRLIGVGVDTPGELGALRHAGVPYAQGEMLGPAAPLRA
jgi:EAL domain-containing protein (putative c-di-GMP-specific phosphodiesterase class I)